MLRLKIQDEPIVASLLMTKKATAYWLSMSERTLQAFTHPRGDLHCVRLPGGGLRYRRSTVEAWAAAREAAVEE